VSNDDALAIAADAVTDDASTPNSNASATLTRTGADAWS